MYNKTIIRFGFCDIQNNQGLGSGHDLSRPWLFRLSQKPHLIIVYCRPGKGIGFEIVFMVVLIDEPFCYWPRLPSIVLCPDEGPGCVLNVVCLNLLISQAGVFMGFSITSAVLGGVIIICYSIAISQLRRYDSRRNRSRTYYNYNSYSYRYGRDNYNYHGKMAVLAIMLVLGIVTFGTGIWAAICTCLMKPCSCCGQPPVSYV